MRPNLTLIPEPSPEVGGCTHRGEDARVHSSLMKLLGSESSASYDYRLRVSVDRIVTRNRHDGCAGRCDHVFPLAKDFESPNGSLMCATPPIGTVSAAGPFRDAHIDKCLRVKLVTAHAVPLRRASILSRKRAKAQLHLAALDLGIARIQHCTGPGQFINVTSYGLECGSTVFAGHLLKLGL